MGIFKTKWGKWTDLTVSSYFETRYLLQGRRHKDGRVQFRVVKSPAIYCAEKLELKHLETLTSNSK